MADGPKKPESKKAESRKAEPKKREPEAATRARAGAPKASAPVAGEGLARPEPEELLAFPQTEAAWAVWLDDLVDVANRGIRRASVESEAVADGLFRACFLRDVAAGLEPEKAPTDAFLRLSERAGASLNLSHPELVRYVRVGAMNQHRRDGAWLDLHWSKKLLLVELLELKDGMDLLKQGIELAGKANVGLRHVRAWVQEKKPKKPGPGRPRNDTFSLSSGGRFAEKGVQLKSERQRRAFVKALAKAPAAKRQRLVKDLRDALEGLQALVAELDGLDDE